MSSTEVKKRKAEEEVSDGPVKRGKLTETQPQLDDASVVAAFRSGLFDDGKLQKYQDAHDASEPYRHCVISSLTNDDLLRSVRSEIQEHLHFTPKQTDIYSIHQTGDLANLSGLSAKEAALFPSLTRLRDALYSQKFRTYIQGITSSGPLSGKKTDMAINVYTKGCHLLTHDDVIGTRRVSYILYLTDPDDPWKANWGGGLRLYPTKPADDDREMRIPLQDWSLVIPPAFNQLSFFKVQPGYSFHDVEEVFEEGKVRMAISGWFHIPQEGEEGYIEGLEEELAEKSSLQQLQSKSEKYDLPQPNPTSYPEPDIIKARESEDEGDEDDLTQQDFDFLIKFMNPNYLIPDTLDDLCEIFAENSSVQLADFLSNAFQQKLKEHMTRLDASRPELPSEIPSDMLGWKVSSPPHKSRYLYYQPNAKNPPVGADAGDNPFYSLIYELLPSTAFKKILQLATGVKVVNHDLLARRFRPGLDYSLATGYDGDQPRVECVLGLTPNEIWEEEDEEMNGATNGKSKGKSKAEPTPSKAETYGGYEAYMAGDDEDSDSEAEGDKVKDDVDAEIRNGGGSSKKKEKKKADPAVYKSSARDDEDGGIMFSVPACWNTMSIAYRDKGTLRFVKYVTSSAPGSRWDVGGVWDVADDDDDDDDDDEEGGEKSAKASSAKNGQKGDEDADDNDDDEEEEDFEEDDEDDGGDEDEGGSGEEDDADSDDEE